MEATPDDPPESNDQSRNVDNDASIVHTWPPSTELANQSSDAAYNDHGDQEETQSGESDNSQTESKAAEKSPCKMQQGAIFSGKILSFCCSECKGDTTYSPNDLLKHFQGAHKGTLPTYPCDLCTFVTNEFSSLQRHRIGHRDTLVTCEICNDGVQYSLLLLTRHFIMCHSCNGLFRCKKCDFSTRDAGTFVQHIHHHNEGSHKCVRCPPMSPTQGKVLSGTFPFTCQFCGYGAARREYLNKHLTVAHGDEMDRTNRWKATEDSGVNNSGLKLLLKKSPAGGSRESQWMSKLNSLPGVGLLDHNGRLFNPEKTLEETQQFLERAVGVKKESSKWSKSPLKSEPQCSYPVTPTTPQPKIQETELSSGSGILNSGNSNGLTVLMVKNKISIPPNCTTKVMGFKMVDGKKHLVLKVIPTKQEPSMKNEMSPADLPEDDKKTVSSPCSSLSPRSKSLFRLDSEKKKDFTASLRAEAQDIEKDTGGQSPLLDEHEANVDRTSIAPNQVGCETLQTSSQLLTPPSDSTCIDLVSTVTKEALFGMNQVSHSDRMKSSQQDHELSVTDLSVEKSQSKTLTVVCSLAAEITPTDMVMVKAQSNTSVDSGMDEMSQSESIADEPAPLEVISDAKTDLILISPSGSPPSALPSNCVADDATPSADLGKSPGQMGHSVDNKSCDISTEQSCASERIIGQRPPRAPVKRSPRFISEDEEKRSPVAGETESSLSESTATVCFSNLANGKISRMDSLSDFSLATNSSPSKELASDSTAVDNQSSSVTPNGTTVSHGSPQNKTKAGESPDAKDCNKGAETLLQNSPSQEVFSFHNYSKDSFSSSPDSLEADENSPEDLEDGECEEDFDELKLASDWSLTLPASPPLGTELPEEENVGSGGEGSAANEPVPASEKKALERVADSDIEVDECIATVDDTDDDLPIPVLPEAEHGTASLSESGKKEEEGVSPAVEKGTTTLSNAAVLGKILEKHSDAIISQQLEKERMVSSAAVPDPIRPTKTTLRILQTPEGKQQMFLQTTETPYAVQLKSSPGFKLITKSCASKLNVSYVKPGIERPSKGTGLSLTLNGGRIGMSAQGSSREGEGHASLLQAVSSSGGRYFVNASALKGPLLLSGAVKPPSGEQTTNTQPTCYLVQRPLPVVPVSNESIGSTSKTVLTTRPLLAMPVNSADKAAPLQTGRQAYLVRYISPAKSGILLNSSDGKGASQGSHANEGGKSRVFLKIVRSPNGTRFLSTAPCTSAKKPIYVAASSLQSPYFLMSSHNSFTSLSAGLKTSNTHELIPGKLTSILPQSSIDIKNRAEDSIAIQKSPLSPLYTRSQSQRKRRRRGLFEEPFESSPKTRRISSKSSEVSSLWEPAAKDVERTLRLSPFSPLQEIKCPRRNQPVVVLNHPDADIPEVANIMKSVNRYKSEVVKVALSQSTVKALSEWSFRGAEGALSKPGTRVQPLGSNVRERFILKLKLKKKSRSKYEVVRLSSTTGSEQMPKFNCWFCGRVFNNQEEWIGHGQRHLMEATRDWNKLF
ncbi:zinc finger protein 518A [Pygocentrus nattereri]|uniref:C2H2-type domain-containing protein n=1 Tax=Pygocentrus nattereri TaxID=42514 RepID=A0A3B4BNP7_PYGNA|nr:zinc finger protein 518A [Pygocentrus nattereri]